MSDPVKVRMIEAQIIEGLSPEVTLTPKEDGVEMAVTTKSGTKRALIPKGDTYELTVSDKTEIAQLAFNEYAESATEHVLESEGFAVGKRGGVDVDSDSPYYHNNAKYYAEQAAGSNTAAQAAKTAAQEAAATASAAYGTDLLAPDFSTSSTYAVGDYVIHSGDLYRCTTAVTTAGEWNNSSWTQVAVGGEVGALKSAINVLEPIATSDDIGKTLVAKTVSDGKVTEYEFGKVGGGYEYQFVPTNLIDPDNLVGTMMINGSSVSGLSNWIPVKEGAFYTTDYTYTQFYLFDTSKNYVSTTTRISAINRFQVEIDGYLLIRISGDLTKKIVRGSYLEYGKGIVSRWNNKKWLAIGDSITDIQYASEGYPYWVGSNLGMEVTNVGTSGKTMAWFHSLIAGYADDFDLITVLLGTNNQGYNTAIGALNDQYYQDEEYDSNNSFFAQTQRLADLLIDKYPKATIAFFTPIRRSVSSSDGADMTNAHGLTTQAYANAVKDVCDYYSLPCIDLYTHGINPRYDSVRAYYFVNGDGTHPNNRGHARFTAPVINQFFNSLAPFVIVEMISISAVYNGTDVPVGTDVSTLDVTVTGNYSDGSTEEITDYTISGTIEAGENTVTITYGNFSTTITVTGESMVLSSITAVYNGGDVLVGTDVNDLDITVTAHYTNGYSETLTDGYTVSGTIASGQNTVTIAYSGFTATVTVVGVTTVLIHSYAYSSTYEDGLTDSVGDKNLSYYSNGKRLYNDDIGNEHLSSFSIVWTGVSRTSNYFSQIPFLTTAVKNGFNGNPHTNNGDRISLRISPPGGSGTFGDGHIRLQVDISNTPDSYYGSAVIANNSTHTFVLTFDANTKKYCVYVDGVLDIEQVSDALCAVDGFTIEQANYIANGAWTGLQIYSGVVDINSLT